MLEALAFTVDGLATDGDGEHFECRIPGGAGRARTDDPRLARAVLSQLSYSPDQPLLGIGRPRQIAQLVGLGRLELPTSRLSGVRSNQLSYRP